LLDKKVKALLFMKAHSERVPGKNKRLLHGRPLFHWIMDALNESGVVDEIIINTDSEEIAESARKYFNVTIHMRPKYLLNIQANEPFQIMSYDLNITDGEYFIQTHSTNPLVKAETIKDAVEIFFANMDQYDSLFSVTPLQTRLYDGDFNALNHDPNNLIKTQNLPYIYEENSCIYIFSRSSFSENKNRIGIKPYLFPINRHEAVDIDEEFDFLLAKTLMQDRISKTV
jgi:CMP-N-acetylneuraminic acid synthetase